MMPINFGFTFEPHTLPQGLGAILSDYSLFNDELLVGGDNDGRIL